MAEKKTEIVVGFTNHTPSFVDKELANMKKADVILFEFPAYGIEQLKRGTMEPHHLAAKSNFPEAAERMFRALKRMSHDGKMVYGYEDVHNDRLWSREERARKNALDDATELPFKTRLHSTKSNLMKSARAFAELTKIRDQKAAEWVKANLPKFEGKKIYISAGSLHTPLYHMLKKELEPKGVSVGSVFLTKDFHKTRGILERYGPYHQLGRALLFNTPSSRDKKKVRKYIKDTKRFFRKANSLVKKHQKTMSYETAQEKANYELLNAEKRTWFGKRRKR